MVCSECLDSQRPGGPAQRAVSPVRVFSAAYIHTVVCGVSSTAPLSVRSYILALFIGQKTGGVRAEHAYSGISWTALTLEVGKSPTEVPPGRRLPVAPPSAICEFTSSSSPS